MAYSCWTGSSCHLRVRKPFHRSTLQHLLRFPLPLPILLLRLPQRSVLSPAGLPSSRRRSVPSGGKPVVPTGCLPLSLSGRISLPDLDGRGENGLVLFFLLQWGRREAATYVQWPRSAMLEAPGKAVQRNFHCHQPKSGSGGLLLGWCCSTTTIFTSFN